MMTSLLTMKLVKKLNLNIHKTQFQVSKHASSIQGTTATLQHNEQLSLFDLLHGMMLPSGNDAAMTLAENLGILNSAELAAMIQSQARSLDAIVSAIKPQRNFIEEMNKLAKKLQLLNTLYQNPHGLQNNNAYSTAFDQARVSCMLLEDEILSQIVAKPTYSTNSKINNKPLRQITWTNTNKLLSQNKNIIGVKTGVTGAAGPCLSSCWQFGKIKLVSVILCSKSMDIRWDETEQLFKWGVQQLEKQSLYSDQLEGEIQF